jgi:hypothetical protein
MAVTAQGSGTKISQVGVAFTVNLASPADFTLNGHGFVVGDKLRFATTGALPTGLATGTDYYVIAAGLTANAFRVSLTEGGAAVNTSVSQSGTHTIASIEALLLDVAVAGTFTMHVDKSVLAAGDAIEQRIYQMVLTGGTRRVAYFDDAAGAQPADDAISISVPISNELTDAGSLRFTLKQIAGASRSFPWKVLKYA